MAQVVKENALLVAFRLYNAHTESLTGVAHVRRTTGETVVMSAWESLATSHHSTEDPIGAIVSYYQQLSNQFFLGLRSIAGA